MGVRTLLRAEEGPQAPHDVLTPSALLVLAAWSGWPRLPPSWLVRGRALPGRCFREEEGDGALTGAPGQLVRTADLLLCALRPPCAGSSAPRASSHPDSYRRYRSSTGSARCTGPLGPAPGSRTVTADSDFHRPRSTCSHGGYPTVRVRTSRRRGTDRCGSQGRRPPSPSHGTTHGLRSTSVPPGVGPDCDGRPAVLRCESPQGCEGPLGSAHSRTAATALSNSASTKGSGVPARDTAQATTRLPTNPGRIS